MSLGNSYQLKQRHFFEALAHYWCFPTYRKNSKATVNGSDIIALQLFIHRFRNSILLSRPCIYLKTTALPVQISCK